MCRYVSIPDSRVQRFMGWYSAEIIWFAFVGALCRVPAVVLGRRPVASPVSERTYEASYCGLTFEERKYRPPERPYGSVGRPLRCADRVLHFRMGRFTWKLRRVCLRCTKIVSERFDSECFVTLETVYLAQPRLTRHYGVTPSTENNGLDALGLERHRDQYWQMIEKKK